MLRNRNKQVTEEVQKMKSHLRHGLSNSETCIKFPVITYYKSRFCQTKPTINPKYQCRQLMQQQKTVKPKDFRHRRYKQLSPNFFKRL